MQRAGYGFRVIRKRREGRKARRRNRTLFTQAFGLPPARRQPAPGRLRPARHCDCGRAQDHCALTELGWANQLSGGSTPRARRLSTHQGSRGVLRARPPQVRRFVHGSWAKQVTAQLHSRLLESMRSAARSSHRPCVLSANLSQPRDYSVSPTMAAFAHSAGARTWQRERITTAM